MTAAKTQIVRIELGERSYDIEIGAESLDRLGPMISVGGEVRHAIVITDENVEQPHAIAAAEGLAAAGIETDVLVVPPGEASKSIEMASDLWEKMLAVGTDRRSVVVAVGGGVVGDLAGFVAATFARGLGFYQVPTTLLAQVDSSVGGKVGVNLPAAKNMVGVFWQPRGVLIDTSVLQTLPAREYRSGLAEVVKYGVILDAEFFQWLEQNIDGLRDRDETVLRHVVARSCRLKADVVEADERELTGLRAVLNYGHTFGHALESTTGYIELLHGEAISLGMLCASRLAERLGRIDAELTARQQDLLAALGLPIEMPALDAGVILSAMKHDKKAAGGRLRFVLPDRLGHVELVGDVPEDDIVAAMGLA